MQERAAVIQPNIESQQLVERLQIPFYRVRIWTRLFNFFHHDYLLSFFAGTKNYINELICSHEEVVSSSKQGLGLGFGKNT